MNKRLARKIENLHWRADAIKHLIQAIIEFRRECAERALLHDLNLPIPARRMAA